MSWKTLLQRHDKMVVKGNALIYDRIVILRQVNDDPQFKRDNLAEGISPADLLNAKVSDTCASFIELVHMVKLFPDREQWLKGNLADMQRLMIDTIRRTQVENKARAEGEGGANNADRKLSWKQKYLEMESRYNVLEGRYQQLEKDYQQMHHSLNTLRQAN